MNHPNALAANNSSSFKYKSSILGEPDADGILIKKSKNAIPLKHSSNFWRPLEIPLINCKVYAELNLTKICVMSDDDDNNDTAFKITNTKLYVAIVTLSTEDNETMKQSNSRFKRSVGISTIQN